MIEIPNDWPVQPLEVPFNGTHPTTCGTCGLTWDDGASTPMTPVPSGRCPFEWFHPEPHDSRRASRRASPQAWRRLRNSLSVSELQDIAEDIASMVEDSPSADFAIEAALIDVDWEARKQI